jgi:hypothetical protein
MNNKLKQLSEIVARANDIFFSQFEKIDTLMGIMDKTLRNQGMNADAITIDCITLDKKIVMLLHDDKPDMVNITLGNKAGEIESSNEFSVSDVSEVLIVNIMKKSFT